MTKTRKRKKKTFLPTDYKRQDRTGEIYRLKLGIREKEEHQGKDRSVSEQAKGVVLKGDDYKIGELRINEI